MAVYEDDLKLNAMIVEVWRMEVKFPLVGNILILGAYHKKKDGSVTASITYEGGTSGGIAYNETFITEIAGKNALLGLYEKSRVSRIIKNKELHEKGISF
jgi:hypothetical protein